MLIKDQKAQVKWNSFTKKYYVQKGYPFTKMGDSFLVTIDDLLKGSSAKVDVVCDYCGKIYQKSYKDYYRQHENGDCCKQCGGKKSLVTGELKYGKNYRGKILKEISLERYNIDNVAKHEIIKEKIANTNLERYGVTCVLCKEYPNRKDSYSWNKESREKRENTNLEKYGYKYSLSSPVIRKKINESYHKNGTQKTSSQQLKIFEMIKTIYNNGELNYSCGKYSLDCMVLVDGIKIDIEYDGEYWHQDKQKDIIRDEFIEANNYKILRIKGSHNIPTENELIDAINELINGQKTYIEIKLS